MEKPIVKLHVEKQSTKTYSFCERGAIKYNANRKSILSDRLSSIYGVAAAPIETVEPSPELPETELGHNQ